MAKRNDHSRQEMRDLAIHAAQACMQEHGIRGINARKIAKAMGYAVGTLYQLFKSMDLLILAVNIKTLKALEQEVLQVIAQHQTKQAMIKQIAMTYVSFALANTKRWQALFEHQLPNDLEVPEAYVQQRSRMFQALEQQFCLAYPEMNQAQAALEARALWAGVHGVCILALGNKLDDEGMSLVSIAEVLVDHFLAPQQFSRSTT